MGFGMRIRGLWRIRGWVAACAVFALAAAGWSVAQISLSPADPLAEMATA